MSQQEFNQLLKRYLAGESTPEEDGSLMEWYDDPANRTEMDLTESQKSGIQRRMWRNIRRQTRPTASTRIIRWGGAISMAACLVLGWVWLGPAGPAKAPDMTMDTTKPASEVVEVKNSSQPEQGILLPDGTRVTLTKNSSLIYDETFGNSKREVHLRGEAFFEVKRDTSKPFVVHAGQLVTEVLGTSFRIKQQGEGKTIEVSVREGKVSVYAEGEQRKQEHDGVIITQNQRVLFDAATRHIVPSIVEAPVPVILPEQAAPDLVFHEASFEKVLAELTRLYGIEFVISNPAVKECRITADLHGLPMFTQLNLLCKSVGASYDKRGTVVFISGDGC